VSSAPITVSGAADTHPGANYLFLYDNGTLLVDPAPLSVSGSVRSVASARLGLVAEDFLKRRKKVSCLLCEKSNYGI
jgi:hypothetical protein